MSLVELMIGIAIALILLAGVLTVMLRITTSGAESVAATRLNQALRGSLDLMTKDLQRAGYVRWNETFDSNGDGSLNADDDVNGDGVLDVLDFYEAVIPAFHQMGDVTLWSFPSPGTASGTPAACTANCDCVLFSYDLNEDGNQGIGSGTPGPNQNDVNFELFGYRWNDGAIEMRTAGDTHSCNSGTWQDITDDNISVTNLSFNMTYATAVGAGNDSTAYEIGADAVTGEWSWNGAFQNTCVPNDEDVADPIPTNDDVLCLWRRNVAIGVTATLSSDANVTMTLNTDVKIKNDYFDSQP